MARVDYYNDPDAPKANSLVLSVTAIVPDQDGAILMVHKTDNDLWALPGGGMDVGESMADTVVREVKEETGIDVEVTGVVGIYTNPNHVMAYDDGEVRQQCSICFTTRLVGGTLATSSETKEVRFVAPGNLEALNISPVDAVTDQPLPGASQRALHRLIGPGHQPNTSPGNGFPQHRMRAADGSVYRVIGRVALQDLGDALLEIDALPGRAGGHVGIGERIQQRPVLGLELGQLVYQAALLGLEPGARVVGDQRGQSLLALLAHIPGAVEGMEAEPVQWRGVADVVQPGGGDQVGAILGCERGAHLAGLSGDGLDVAPAVAETREEPGGLLLGPGGKLGRLHTADPIRRWWPEEAGSGPPSAPRPFGPGRPGNARRSRAWCGRRRGGRRDRTRFARPPQPR
jgi:ADP-ribose pyrophosphatase YjhB (NUDIX family)